MESIEEIPLTPFFKGGQHPTNSKLMCSYTAYILDIEDVEKNPPNPFFKGGQHPANSELMYSYAVKYT